MTSNAQATHAKILSLIFVGYGLLAIFATIRPVDSESAAGVVLAISLLSVYVLHSADVPGLLEHNGLCGAGWCSPTSLLDGRRSTLAWHRLASFVGHHR